jgi:hypothetical protein
MNLPHGDGVHLLAKKSEGSLYNIIRKKRDENL